MSRIKGKWVRMCALEEKQNTEHHCEGHRGDSVPLAGWIQGSA